MHLNSGDAVAMYTELYRLSYAFWLEERWDTHLNNSGVVAIYMSSIDCLMSVDLRENLRKLT